MWRDTDHLIVCFFSLTRISVSKMRIAATGNYIKLQNEFLYNFHFLFFFSFFFLFSGSDYVDKDFGWHLRTMFHRCVCRVTRYLIEWILWSQYYVCCALRVCGAHNEICKPLLNNFAFYFVTNKICFQFFS